MKTPWNKDKRPKYQQQEQRTAKKKGGRQQINSGRTWSSLRDVSLKTLLGTVLIDNKTTDKASYRITKDEFLALKRDANRTPPGCHPGMQIDIQDLRLLVIEEALWDEIMERAETDG